MREYRSGLIFITATLFSGALLLQMGLYLVHVIMDWKMDYNLIELCHTMLRAYGLNFAGYVLQAIVYQTFLLLLFFILRQAVLSRKFKRTIKAMQDEVLTEEMNLKHRTLQAGITVITNPQPIAMATGFWQPRIILSTGLVKLLSKNELKAVIYHEYYHARSLDPLKTYMLSLFAASLWYIPIMKRFLKNYKLVREVLADRYAIQRMGGTPVELGSALLKLLREGIPVRMPVSHASITDTSINYRIRQIVEPERRLELKWPIGTVMISIKVVALLCALFMIVL